MKSLIFNQKKHKGDCHFCRPFLKSIAANNPGWKFYRCHAIERTLHDVPMEYTKKIIPGVPVVETWIGQQNQKFIDMQKHSTFAFTPNDFTTMFNEICKKCNLICDTLDYIPVIDYSLYEIQKIDNFLSAIQKPCVIVSNGVVLSGQAGRGHLGSPAFMNPIIEKLKPFFTVVVTKNRGQKNEYYIGDIVKRDDEDLAELSYLSTKAHAFIGRSSGPYTFSMVKENFNGKLKMICISEDKRALYWKNASNDYWLSSSSSMSVLLDKITHILGV